MDGFSRAVSGLLASQRALYVTNHNIDNMKTAGYSRQKALQRATSPTYIPGTGFLGNGTEIYDIVRIRSEYTDFKYWTENGPKGEWEIKRDTMTEIEKIMGEPSDSSFRKYMDEFFKALDTLNENPSDIAYREPVKETAFSLTKHINQTAQRLDNLEKEIEFDIGVKVKSINDIANQIASLNKQIYSYEISGNTANDLRDKRELLVDELSNIVNVQVDESKEGKFRVSIGGLALVDHINVSELKYESEDPTKEKKLTWYNDNPVSLRSGELKALMDILNGDGEKSSYRGIPYYKERLDEFARGFARGINEVHRDGIGLNGSTNVLFFAVEGEDIPERKNYEDDDKYNEALDKYYNKFNANNITLSDDILDDVQNIACASTYGGVEDNTNLLKIVALRDDKTFFSGGLSQGTPDDFIKSILSNLSVDSSQAKRMEKTQDMILKNITQRRQSESGVSIDEEIANMISYQHVYNASARMITTIDAVMDVTINRLGLVGR